jgi:hypothetical protein
MAYHRIEINLLPMARPVPAPHPSLSLSPSTMEGVGTQGLMLARQVFYHWSHLTSPFLCWAFWDGVSQTQTICLGWLWTSVLLTSASWVARVTDVSCWYQLLFSFRCICYVILTHRCNVFQYFSLPVILFSCPASSSSPQTHYYNHILSLSYMNLCLRFSFRSNLHLWGKTCDFCLSFWTWLTSHNMMISSPSIYLQTT